MKLGENRHIHTLNYSPNNTNIGPYMTSSVFEWCKSRCTDMATARNMEYNTTIGWTRGDMQLNAKITDHPIYFEVDLFVKWEIKINRLINAFHQSIACLD